jgi:hypothetical protein
MRNKAKIDEGIRRKKKQKPGIMRDRISGYFDILIRD